MRNGHYKVCGKCKKGERKIEIETAAKKRGSFLCEYNKNYDILLLKKLCVQYNNDFI